MEYSAYIVWNIQLILKLWRRLWDLSLFPLPSLLSNPSTVCSIYDCKYAWHGHYFNDRGTGIFSSFLPFNKWDRSFRNASFLSDYMMCVFFDICMLFVSYLRLWKKWKETSINRGITVTGYHWLILYSFWIFVVTITAGI